MKKLLIALSLFALAACSPAPDYEYMQRATVQVLVEVAGEPVGGGSGVLIAEGVLTAAHVVDEIPDEARLVVGFKDGQYVHAEVERVADADIALLSVPTTSGYPLAKVACAAPKVGSPVYAVGHPSALRWAVAAGVVTTLTPDASSAPGAHIYTDAALYRGMSGGPAFGADGSVMGLNEAFVRAGAAGGTSGYGRLISGAAVCDFLKSEEDLWAETHAVVTRGRAPAWQTR